MSYKLKQTTVLNSTHLSVANSLKHIIREYNEKNSKDLIIQNIKIVCDDKHCTSINKIEFIVFESIEVKGKEETHTIGYREYYYYSSYICNVLELSEYTLNDFIFMKEKEQILEHNIEELQNDI